MPQRNLSNKISLPELPGLGFPAEHWVLSTAGRDFKGAARSPGRPAEGARGLLPALDSSGPGRPPLQATGVPLDTWA